MNYVVLLDPKYHTKLPNQLNLKIEGNYLVLEGFNNSYNDINDLLTLMLSNTVLRFSIRGTGDSICIDYPFLGTIVDWSIEDTHQELSMYKIHMKLGSL